jgi:hypothetical protein
MPTPALTREQAQEALDIFNTSASRQDAADALGISLGAFANRLRRAYAYGLDDSTVAPAGEGRFIGGVSTLYDADGTVKAQWVKEYLEKDAASTLVDELLRVFSQYVGHARIPPKPKKSMADLLTVYPISDHHLGLYAWAEETGDDYDLDIGAQLLRDAMGQLVASSPPSEKGMVLILGDFFHADTSKNQTAQSGNPLDVDTRYAKVIRTGIQLTMDCIEMAMQRHDRVIVKVMPGNHDEHTALCLAAALSLFFKGSHRVEVDPSPSRVYAYQFGSVMIASTHGDMIKMKDLGGVMAANWPEMWGQTKYRYGYTGHIHHNSRIENNGAQVESFQTLAAKDAWHHNSGYSSGRSMVSITHHMEKGEFARCTVSV